MNPMDLPKRALELMPHNRIFKAQIFLNHSPLDLMQHLPCGLRVILSKISS